MNFAFLEFHSSTIRSIIINVRRIDRATSPFNLIAPTKATWTTTTKPIDFVIIAATIARNDKKTARITTMMMTETVIKKNERKICDLSTCSVARKLPSGNAPKSSEGFAKISKKNFMNKIEKIFRGRNGFLSFLDKNVCQSTSTEKGYRKRKKDAEVLCTNEFEASNEVCCKSTRKSTERERGTLEEKLDRLIDEGEELTKTISCIVKKCPFIAQACRTEGYIDRSQCFNVQAGFKQEKEHSLQLPCSQLKRETDEKAREGTDNDWVTYIDSQKKSYSNLSTKQDETQLHEKGRNRKDVD